MYRSGLLLVSLCVACSGGADTKSAQKVDPVKTDKPKVVIKQPDEPPEHEVSPGPSTDAPKGVTDAAKDSAKVHWDSDYWVQSMAVDDTHIYVSRVALPQGDRGEIARVPLAGGKLETLAGDLGRPDSLIVDGGELFWIERPGREGDPASGIRAIKTTGGEIRQVATDPRVEHGLAVTRDMVYWVLRVEEQGKVGGLAGAPRAGGETKDFYRDKGPVFHTRGAGDRLFFMAHLGSAPDIIYSMDQDGSNLREHHSALRGIVALHVDESQVYWGQADFDNLKTSIMAAPLGGGEARTLWTLEGKLLDQVSSDTDSVWASTSAVEDLGEVFRVPKAGGDATKVAESRHVWRLFNPGAKVHWWDTHYTEQKKMHRVRSAK